jgi:hypothetical protein
MREKCTFLSMLYRPSLSLALRALRRKFRYHGGISVDKTPYGRFKKHKTPMLLILATNIAL